MYRAAPVTVQMVLLFYLLRHLSLTFLIPLKWMEMNFITFCAHSYDKWYSFAEIWHQWLRTICRAHCGLFSADLHLIIGLVFRLNNQPIEEHQNSAPCNVALKHLNLICENKVRRKWTWMQTFYWQRLCSWLCWLATTGTSSSQFWDPVRALVAWWSGGGWVKLRTDKTKRRRRWGGLNVFQLRLWLDDRHSHTQNPVTLWSCSVMTRCAYRQFSSCLNLR